MPVGWETHSSPLLGDRPQAIINEQILKHSDLLVAVFWTRLGTATSQALSGTVEEIESHISLGKPAMIYFSAAPVVPDSVDYDQFRALQDFKREISSRGLFESYESLSEFKEKFSRQLAKILNTHDYFMDHSKEGPIETSGADPTMADPNRISPPQGKGDPLSRIINKKSALSSRVSPDAAELLTEAARDEDGLILRVGTFGGLEISTNGRDFVDDKKSARVEARWEEALRELNKKGLILDKSNKGEIFGLTKLGYQVADSAEG